MNTIDLKQSIKNHQFWLVAIAACYLAIYFTLLWKMDNIAHLGMSGLFFLAIYSLISDRKDSLQLESSLLPSLLGLLPIGWVLWISSSIPNTKENPLVSISPFVFALGFILIAAGFEGFKQFKQELFLIFFLGVPRVIIEAVYDISPFTAKISSFLLHYLGFPVQLDGVYILLPQGSVKVYYGCSGMEAITYVLGLSIICLIMFPTKPSHRYFVPIIAASIGFFVNACRVALMAILVNMEQPKAFKYWHEGQGSLIFGMIAVTLFAIFYWFLMQNMDAKPEKTIEF